MPPRTIVHLDADAFFAAVEQASDASLRGKLGCLDSVSAERALCLLEALGFDLFANELLHVDSQHALIVLDGLEEFREHLGGELTVTLLNGIGQGFEVHEMNLPIVIEAIYELKERDASRGQKVSRISA